MTNQIPNIIFDSLFLLIPLWGANIALNFLGIIEKKWKIPDYPLDLHLNWFDDQPLIGNSKTILGIFIAILGGCFVGKIIGNPNGTILGLSAYIGTIFSGFIKRRFKISPGGAFWIIDQTDYILGSIICYQILGKKIIPEVILLSIIITIPIHLVTNILAYKIKLRKYYW
jgi:CDP-2,3-bis-(O-geranylgeranyl)-sn-glycerol synthase